MVWYCCEPFRKLLPGLYDAIQRLNARGRGWDGWSHYGEKSDIWLVGSDFISYTPNSSKSVQASATSPAFCSSHRMQGSCICLESMFKYSGQIWPPIAYTARHDVSNPPFRPFMCSSSQRKWSHYHPAVMTLSPSSTPACPPLQVLQKQYVSVAIAARNSIAHWSGPATPPLSARKMWGWVNQVAAVGRMVALTVW